MKIAIIYDNFIKYFTLPEEKFGSYWLNYNKNDKENKLISVSTENGEWVINSNADTKIVLNEQFISKIILRNYEFYQLSVNDSKRHAFLYCFPSYDNTFGIYKIKNNGLLSIGSSKENQIIYNNPLTSPKHAQITYENNKYVVQNLDNNIGTYANNIKVNKEILSEGDNVFILGLKIVLMQDIVMINNPGNQVKLDGTVFTPIKINTDNIDYQTVEEDLDINPNFFGDDDFFNRSPRFKTLIEPVEIVIDEPPKSEIEEDNSALITIGPMATMGMTSMVTAYTSISGLLDGSRTMNQSLPSLIIALSMMLSMLVWPIVARNYKKKQKIKKEKKRREKYTAYIEEKKKQLEETINIQRQVLKENFLDSNECKRIILNKDRKLWERKIEHNDFLQLRIGIGAAKSAIKVKYPEEHFTMEEDDLVEISNSISRSFSRIENAPITLNLVEKKISAVLGESEQSYRFMNNLILQMITFHSYETLKIVVFTNDSKKAEWDYLKTLPHCFSDDKNKRFFSANLEEIRKTSQYLQNIFEDRRPNELKKPNINGPFYVIIVDGISNLENIEIIKEVMEYSDNLGFSIIIKETRLSDLPSECTTFIDVFGENGEKSGYFENELVSDKQNTFVADLVTKDIMYDCVYAMDNIPIILSSENNELPNIVKFLEMYECGKIEQLNPLMRWEKNIPIDSLKVPIGIDENGELFMLDLHEKQHGPHGLVAGMTGSGKSEFIISYILSMAVNYHPDEVSFVLIDYKGGGLAGAFENKITGVRLPHLAGTITNLDTVELNRSLASIQSELKRRQAIFNKAREQIGEGTIDIYKYQQLYRDKKVSEPISHLFIISDEFAELKSQQPEFMAQLISTARIGRSLGVHLILATQKPSGVVNDQIWSNSKFKICLKVQDKSDSMEMIKRPDAAELTNVGRFYLQVGYNEYFALGQSAWCGAKYVPSEKPQKKIDTSISVINNIGDTIKKNDIIKKEQHTNAKGEELSNIVNYLSNLANSKNIHITPLWLPSIPGYIYVESLKQKYNYQSENNIVNPIIGEYDDPFKQKQGLLTLPLTQGGNTVIYGLSGSGKENLLITLIYSSITTYSVDSVNIYIMDFGAEVLKMFNTAPHVGDIVLQDDEEKLYNLLKVLDEELKNRKKLLLNYNGDFELYNKSNEIPIPTIEVILNNYEAFEEIYEKYVDFIVQYTRECSKYGIIFIVTASTTGALKYKLAQNFEQKLALQLNDKIDYTGIVGRSDNGIMPSKIFGRGLVRLDDVYEFQTAYAYKKEELNAYIKNVCTVLKGKTKNHAKKIPSLPHRVSIDSFEESINIDKFPVGIYKESIKNAYFDFDSNGINLLLSQSITNVKPFAEEFIKIASLLNNSTLIVVDPSSEFTDKEKKYPYYGDNVDLFVERINKYIESKTNDKKILCLIYGMNKFVQKINDDKLLEQLIQNSISSGLVKYIFAEDNTSIKLIEHLPWYITNVKDDTGIWIGDGVANQFALKLTTLSRDLQTPIENNFGYIIKNGKPELLKLIQSKRDDSNE